MLAVCVSAAQPNKAFALTEGEFTYEIGNWKWEDEDTGIVKDCGYGARITSYTGTKDAVCIPNKIGGQSVVSVSIGSDDEADILTVDVSRCSSLKGLGVWAPRKIEFGGVSSIKFFSMQDGSRMDYLDLSKQKGLETFYVHGYLPGSWNWSTESLKYVGTTAGSVGSLNLAGASKLEVLEFFMSVVENYQSSLTSDTLNLDGCTSLRRLKLGGCCLTSFDVSRYPHLEYLYLARNYIQNTSALDAWLAKDGHEGQIQPQYSPKKTFDAKDVVLSSNSYVYDGQPKKPSVRINGLKEGEDFWVHYFDNVSVGTARVVVGGMNDYRGVSVAKNFTIVKGQLPASPISISSAIVTVAPRVYTGKTLTPAAPAVTLNGKALRNGVDFTFACKGGKKIGSYTVTVTGRGAYAGSRTATFQIVPKGATIKKPAAAKKALTAKWKAPSKAHQKQITGYKVEWSTDKAFKKGVKSKLVKGAKKTSLKVTKLKSKKTYYVRVCSYKKIGKAYYYSPWSKVQKAKVK